MTRPKLFTKSQEERISNIRIVNDGYTRYKLHTGTCHFVNVLGHLPCRAFRSESEFNSIRSGLLKAEELVAWCQYDSVRGKLLDMFKINLHACGLLSKYSVSIRTISGHLIARVDSLTPRGFTCDTLIAISSLGLKLIRKVHYANSTAREEY